ncbi:hypothetical protein pb186bvf_017564 [Paramecium bursaria]
MKETLITLNRTVSLKQQNSDKNLKQMSTIQSEISNDVKINCYHYVLVFTIETKENQLKQIIEKLQQNGFITYQTQDLNKKFILLFIYMNDNKQILTIAQQLQFYKSTVDKDLEKSHQIHKPILEKLYMKQILDSKLIDELNRIDKRIVEYQRLKKFNYVLKDEFSTKHDDETLLKIFSQSEILIIVNSHLHTIKIGDLDLLYFLKKENYLTNIIPVHEDNLDYVHDDQIEQYFGANVAIYFEFMYFYQACLKYLGVISLLVYLMNRFYLNIPLIEYVYSVVVMVWSTMFIILWRRREHEIGFKWGVINQEHNKKIDLNHEFKGIPKLNLSTGFVTLKFTTTQRLFYYMLSGFEAIPILFVAGLLKVIVFNINGFIRHEHSLFYMKDFANLNKPGGALHFAYTGTILDILVILLIFYINLLYTRVCINSTRRENHKTNLHFQNSVILKRFIFELINRFFHLFYIAFVEYDILTLQDLLTKLFVMDQIRRVILESLVPMAMKEQQKRSIVAYKEKMMKKTDQSEYIVQRIAELDLWEYDNFDDYIEVVFQYGYLVLFASIIPLAAFITYLFSYIEIWSDKFKLCHKLYQRNMPIKTKTIGMWRMVLNAMSVLSIYTNTAFISLSYYNMFELCQRQQCDWTNILIVLFILEHFLLTLKFAIFHSVKGTPKWVRILKKRLKKK